MPKQRNTIKESENIHLSDGELLPNIIRVQFDFHLSWMNGQVLFRTQAINMVMSD